MKQTVRARFRSGAWAVYRRAFEVAPGLAHRLRTWISRYPWLYMPYARALYSSSKVAATSTRAGDAVRRVVLQEDTEILIEGAARSANTFAVAAFKVAQPRPVKMAFRLHAAAHVIAAVRKGVPTLVLIRDPEDAVLSYAVKHSLSGLDIEIRQALKAWVYFYEGVFPHRDEFVLGRFKTVVTDFGTLVHRVNQEFDTSFDEFDHSEKNAQECLQLLEKEFQRIGMGEVGTSVPSEERERRKDALRSHFRSADLERMRHRAYDVYGRMISAQDAVDVA